MGRKGRTIAAGILQGLSGGFTGAKESLDITAKSKIKNRQDAAREALKKSNLQREYEFMQGLDEEGRQNALTLASAGGLAVDPKSRQWIKQTKGGKTGKPKEKKLTQYQHGMKMEKIRARMKKRDPSITKGNVENLKAYDAYKSKGSKGGPKFK